MHYFNGMFMIIKPSVQQLYVGLQVYSLMHIPLSNENPFSLLYFVAGNIKTYQTHYFK